MQPDVFIVGASVRAAAESALRAGMVPICADLFADEDLREIARVVRVDAYPSDLSAVAATTPICPWIYTGALENRPDIIAEISAARRLWGNLPTSIAAVRDPVRVANALHQAELPFAEVRLRSQQPPCDGTWLVKPLRSAGGRGIRVWEASAAQSEFLPGTGLFSKAIRGSRPFCCVHRHHAKNSPHRDFAPARRRPCIWRIGFYVLWVDRSGLACPEYRTGDRTVRIVHRSARSIARFVRIDFVCDHQHAVLVEINPRYTASVEVFERAWGVALLDWHRRACESFDDAARSELLDEQIASQARSLRITPPAPIVGKAIVFADEPIMTRSLKEAPNAISAGVPLVIADRPAPNTEIASGRPICTLLIEGKTCDDCRAGLVDGARALHEWLSSEPGKS